jgi:transposase
MGVLHRVVRIVVVFPDAQRVHRRFEYESRGRRTVSAPWISWSRIPWIPHAAVPSEQREGSMGRRGYPPEFRQRVLDLVAAGRGVEDVARDLGISDQTIYSWRHQDRIDHGLEAGLTSVERAELLSARRRIHELETELAIHRRAAELLKGTTSPKKDSRQSR